MEDSKQSQSPEIPDPAPQNAEQPLACETRRGGNVKITPEILEEVCKHYATGMSQDRIARAYGVERRTIMRHLNTPEALEKLQFWRAMVKQTILERLATGLTEGVANKLETAIKSGDAKDVDAASRAMLNVEKVSASAAGEGQKVQVSGPGGVPLQVDIRAILADLRGHIGGE